MEGEQHNVKFKIQGGTQGTAVVPSDATGLALAAAIARSASLSDDPTTLKIICGGKRVDLEALIRDQRLNLKSSLLVMRSSQQGTPETAKKAEEHKRTELESEKLEMYKKAAMSFAKRASDESGQYYAEICDQNGKPVDMPESDRRNLVAGQMLQEQGRKLLAQNKTEEALFMLMEADKHFSLVSLALLAIVDNYGYLCLDIAWAHYRLQKLENLKDAREKLRAARNALERAHGKNLERLTEVKGENIPEKTLYVRLFLLEGVVAYHRGETVSAASYFRQGEDALNALVITDDDLAPLLGMGFTLSESRRALRLCHKDREAAVEAVMRRREELRVQQEEARAVRRQRKLGKTANGGWVDMKLLEQLGELGFERTMAAEALKQTNNDFGLSVDVLTNNPEVLMRRVETGAPRHAAADPGAIAELEAMGFSSAQAAEALARGDGVLDRAVSLLLSGDILVEDDGRAQQMDDGPDEDHPVELPPPETEAQRIERERKEHERNVKRLAEADLIESLAGADQDHESMFDLDLVQETELLQTYKAMLINRGKWA